MRTRASDGTTFAGTLLGCLLVCAATRPALAHGPRDQEFQPPQGHDTVLYKPLPTELLVAELDSGIELATVTDVELADFDGDHDIDIAVAWFATDNDDMSACLRVLTILSNEDGRFGNPIEFDLYIPDYVWPAKSIFRNGTSEIGVGDFDGDGDPDLAVAAFFGDEIWFIENLGAGAYEAHLRFPFGFSSPGNFITPPEMAAADFDGDGRDELVYISDPILQIDGQIIHIWKTTGSIADIYRVDWEGVEGAVYTQWTRGLAVGDFNSDGQPDLCFSGSVNPPHEDDPILTFWYDLDVTTSRFAVHNEYPDTLCSDVVPVRPDPAAPWSVLLADIDGTRVEFWRGTGDPGEIDIALATAVTGYAGLSPNRGMTAVTADVDGDGDPDLITKQKLGSIDDANQIEITLSSQRGTTWELVAPMRLDSSGFCNFPYSEILRPRNLAVADLFGSTLPEIVVGFGPHDAPTRGDEPRGLRLPIVIWANSCIGDVNHDGTTSIPDLVALARALGWCTGSLSFDPDADLNKDGCVDQSDLGLLLADVGCLYSDCEPDECAGQLAGDANCDALVDVFDVDPFILAVGSGRRPWEERYGVLDCGFFCVNDMNRDGVVDLFDIDAFVLAVTEGQEGHGAPAPAPPVN